MSRLKSIDIFRGICMAWMYLGHLLEWWIKPEFLFINTITHKILDSVGASGFLFISGVSIAFSFNKKLNQKSYSQHYVRNNYFFRAFLLFIIALLYNLPTALFLNDLTKIWTWFVLLTASISLFIAWPLLRIKISIRIIVGFSLWIINFFLFEFFYLFKGELSVNGVIYHILYNEPQLDPILNFFPFFLFGTVYGDLVSRLDFTESKVRLKEDFRSKLLFPIGIISVIFIIFGLIFYYPDFLIRGTVAWNFYSLGIDLILLLIFLYFELYIGFKTKKSYRFLFYFSYYSFTVYLVHHLLYFLFLGQLDYISIWFAIVLVFILSGLTLRTTYKYLGPKASIKALLKRLSTFLANKVDSKGDQGGIQLKDG